MTASIDTFGAQFIKYLPGIVSTFNDKVKAKKILKVSENEHWEGEKLQKDVHVRRSNAAYWGLDGGPAPVSSQQSYVPSECFRRFMYGAVQITAGLLKTATSTEQNAVTAVESELRGLERDISKQYNVSWTRDGTGVVALLGSDTSGTTITVNDARALYEGAEFSVVDAGDGVTVHGTFQVESIDPSFDDDAGEATVNLVATLASGSQAEGDFIVQGIGEFMGLGRALTGLDAGVDDALTTFQGVDVSTYTRYSSRVLGNGGTARKLTPSLLRRALHVLSQDAGGDGDLNPTCLGSTGQLINFDEMYEAALRITPDTEEVGTATPTIHTSVGRLTLEADPDAPYGTLFIGDPSAIMLAMQSPLDWMPSVAGGGGGILMQSGSNMSYIARCMEISELFYMERNRWVKVTDLEEIRDTAF